MLGASKLIRISKKLCKVKNSVLPFGGLFVLFSGDFSQLPAVRDRCLYRPIHSIIPSGLSECQREMRRTENEGLSLWELVTETVIILQKNFRTRDLSLEATLTRIRDGKVRPDDLACLHSRVFGAANGPVMTDRKWKTAVLVTPRNIVRQAWNHQATLRHHLQSHRQIFISPAIDKGLSSQDRERVVWETDSNTEMLATWNILAIDGPSVATSNAGTELGISNGTRCVIREVILHPADEIGWYQTGRQPIVVLTRPPICVWTEHTLSANHKTYNFTSIANRRTWFPVLPLEVYVTIDKPTINFYRTQIPLTPGKPFLIQY